MSEEIRIGNLELRKHLTNYADGKQWELVVDISDDDGSGAYQVLLIDDAIELRDWLIRMTSDDSLSESKESP